jgi:diguanylate cyclase (GGDEF)-like protein
VIEATPTRFAPVFDQVRLLDLNGMEIVRVDLGLNNTAKVCQLSQLQDKSDRYYFRESMALSENQIYMSPMDLNIEQGRIEIPHKPMIRFAAPVFDVAGKRIGLLVFNYLAQQILSDLNVHEGDQWILLNETGDYLYGPDPDKNFGFMFPEKKAGFFFDDPDFWNLLSNSRDPKFDRPDGIYFRKTIRPFADDTMMAVSNAPAWTLLMFVPRKNIHTQDRLLVQGLLVAALIMVPILSLLGWFLGRARVKNKWYLASLKASATRDGLTGLLNHRAAMDQLEYQMNAAKRYGHPLSLSYIDLDNLKTINDTLGHRQGDQMILVAAESIRKAIRNTDVAARIGGDEFIVVLPGLAGEDSREVIHRIEDLYVRESRSVFKRELTLSWGVSLWGGISDTMEDFINRADQEMYWMKKEKKSTNSNWTK